MMETMLTAIADHGVGQSVSSPPNLGNPCSLSPFCAVRMFRQKYSEICFP